MGLETFLSSSFLQYFCCCSFYQDIPSGPCFIPSSDRAVNMAPISLELASVPDGLSKLPDVSITELGPESPTLEPFPSLMVPKLSTIRDQSNLTMAQRPNLGRSTSVAFEGQGTVHDFLRMLKNERFRHMPHDGSNWDRILRWADNTAGVVLLSIGILRDFMLNSEDATRLICDSCSSLIQVCSY
jgi:hypothetical protein